MWTGMGIERAGQRLAGVFSKGLTFPRNKLIASAMDAHPPMTGGADNMD
jgi:hypothetical protein